MKTHYQALGINEEADDEVIVAAYKALAKKYHPDTYAGDKKFAEERMKEINIAYGVLSDKAKRKKYDEEIKSKSSSNEFNDDDEFSDSKDGEAALKEDWEILTQIFYEAEICRQYLYRISSALSFNYQIFIIASKSGEIAQEVALDIEKLYLEKYFGKNEDLKDIAKASLIEKKIKVAKDINKKVSLLGNEASKKILADIRRRFSTEIEKLKESSYMDLDDFFNQKRNDIWTKKREEARKADQEDGSNRFAEARKRAKRREEEAASRKKWEKYREAERAQSASQNHKTNEEPTKSSGFGFYEWSVLILILFFLYILYNVFQPVLLL